MCPPEPEQILNQYLRRNAPLFCIELGRDGRVIRTNPFTTRFIGKSLEGLHFREFIVDFHASIDPLRLAEDPDTTHLINLPTHTGLLQTLHCMFYPIEDGVLMLGGVDASEQETLRKQITGQNQQLGNLTRELQKSNAELARLNELKNQFLGMTAHDLRKPVGLIMTYSEFLLDEAEEALDEEQNGFLRRIFTASEFMRHLIDDFLDLAMIESGRIELKRSKSDLSCIIEQVTALVQIHARRKHVVLQISQDAALPRLYLDVQKIEQVLTNIIANAIEYSHEGATVHVRTRYESGAVKITVQDEGVGISEEDLKLLFNPYQKASGQKTGGEKSTGLGLVIARKITEAHGGKISVESAVGKGSVFQILLPVGSPTQEGL